MPPGDPKDAAIPHLPLWRNRVTLVGAIIGYSAIIFLVCFLVVGLLAPINNPYVGLWIYMVLPAFLLVGLVLMPIGLLRERRRRKRLWAKGAQPVLDWGDPGHRRVIKIVITTTLILMPIAGTTAYQGYHYTDSNQFCAKVCHQVMEPQNVAYSRSPHARVPCVECHIGAGAEWYVKSKFSGARQVAAVLLNSYQRPIPPAITELRPARETCEECHWPAKFHGDQLMRIAHYRPDSINTPRHLEMIIKTGGGDPRHGPARGIHWHMALHNTIEYVAADKHLQEIVWVKQTTEQGEEIIYRADGQPASAPKPTGEERTLDCMDCHNRPTHIFRAPSVAVDRVLDAGHIDRSLPFVKREAVAALLRAADHPEAPEETIARHLAEFYEQNYPRVLQEQMATLRRAINVVRDIYSTTFFPEMHIDWRTYPNNIGHKIFPGCFRCHNGNMVNDRGESIRRTCSVCHMFLQREVIDAESSLIRAGRFVHPVALIGKHATTLCNHCHTGGAAPDPTCAGCHQAQAAFLRAEQPDFQRFQIEADPMADVECVTCHDLTKPTTIEEIGRQCRTCHVGPSTEPDAYANVLITLDSELKRAGEAADAVFKLLRAYVTKRASGWQQAADWLTRNEPALSKLRAAGPHHNVQAAKKIYNTLTAEAREIAARINPPPRRP